MCLILERSSLAKMIIIIKRKYRLRNGADIERYIGNYCDFYPDYDIVDKLKELSLKSLIKAFQYIKNNDNLTIIIQICITIYL